MADKEQIKKEWKDFIDSIDVKEYMQAVFKEIQHREEYGTFPKLTIRKDSCK